MARKRNPSRIRIFKNCVVVDLNGKRGGIAVCSVEDIGIVQDVAWRQASTGYAVRRVPRALGGGAESMHCDILGKRPGLVIDHKNRDRLDNRRENLQFSTYSENRFNSAKRFKGVYYVKTENIWFSSLTFEGKAHYLGRFKRKKDAIAARNAAEIKFFGKTLVNRGNK